MVFEGAFTADDARALSKYYGVEKLAFGTEQTLENLGGGTMTLAPTLRDPAAQDAETPAADSDGYVTNFITDKNLSLYVTFDDANATTAATGQSVTASEGLTYEDGVFGNAARLKDSNYLAVDGVSLGTGSYTFAFWLKMETESTSDPVLIAAKNYKYGANPGFAIVTTKWKDIRFNLGTGSTAHNTSCALPSDFGSGWVHVTVTVDRTANTVTVYHDFQEVITQTLSSDFAEQALSAVDKLYIGNDSTGAYGNQSTLDAAIDELMVFDGALDADDVRALSSYYGVESLVPAE
jgi:hypothetical protein